MPTGRIHLMALAATLSLAACGGGGGGGTSPVPTGPATPAPSLAPQSVTVGGTVVEIPSDAYGPATIDGVQYASTDATQTTPLSGATVVVGPVPVIGATPPPTLPTGDVSVTTSATGTFSATLSVAPAAPTSAEPFVIAMNNLSGVTPPPTGYYVEVFGAGTDGLSAGKPVPVHRFLAASTSLALRVTTPTSTEAGALAVVNSDRASNAGAGPLTFDESAQEVARLHASDESTQGYYCHYDTHNVGPTSRYLALGGVGLTGEALGMPGTGVTSASQAFQVTETAILAEKAQTPPGGHYTNLVDSAHLWAGLAAVADSAVSGGFYEVDYDLVTPSAQDSVVGSSGYPVTTTGGQGSTCPTGITDNNS